VFAEIPDEWRNIDSIVALMAGYDGPVQPGGFTELIELIGYIEKEKIIGTMDKTRQALGDLFVNHEGCSRVLAPGSFGAYFSFDGEDHVVLNAAIDTFLERDSIESDFWRRFLDRAPFAIKTQLSRTAPNSFAGILQLKIETFENFREDHTNLENVFRWTAGQWEIQFRGGPLNVYVPLDGLLYLARLIQWQGRGLLPIELRSAKSQFLGGDKSRSIVRNTSVPTENSNFSSDAGELIDKQARNEYKKRLLEIEEGLEEAKEFNDEATIFRLQNEKEQFIAGLLAAEGLGGRPTRISQDAKNARDAVRNAIDRAIDAIGSKDKALESHLRKSIQKKELFKYSPDGEIVWIDH
jgi:hypothetical protein